MAGTGSIAATFSFCLCLQDSNGTLGSVQYLVILLELRLLRQSHDAQDRCHGTRTDRQNRTNQQRLTMTGPAWKAAVRTLRSSS